MKEKGGVRLDMPLICNRSGDCDHKTCIHRTEHALVYTRDPYHPDCVKGAFCYYRDIPVECIECT